MTPLDYYNEKCKAGVVIEDQQQLLVLQGFQRVFDDLLSEHQKRSALTALFRRPHLIKGLYLWGGVGIGKTFLMDCFFHTLPFEQKKRMHFHQFMQRIHQDLTKPRAIRSSTVLPECRDHGTFFDEFYVSICGCQFLAACQSIIYKRVCLFVRLTLPDDLYKYGLQRSQLPHCSHKENTEIINLKSTVDYGCAI